jgi:hypothetical protein
VAPRQELAAVTSARGVLGRTCSRALCGVCKRMAPGPPPLTWDLFSKGEESHRCLSSFPMVTIFCFGPGILNTPRMIL